jgi:hypothetical protein
MPQRTIATRCRATVLAGIAAAGLGLALASPSAGDLNSRQQSLRNGIGADTGRISAYQHRLGDLRGRLRALESSLTIERNLLFSSQNDLVHARTQLARLRASLTTDQRALASQLVAQYETPSPNLVGVVLESDGFPQLLERVNQMTTIATQNARTVLSVRAERARVALQASRLQEAVTHQRRVFSSVLIERDQVAGVQLEILRAEGTVQGDRTRKLDQLRTVEHQLAVLRARALAAQRAAFSSPAASGGVSLATSGEYGFFPAPGTDYSAGREPQIAARLNTLGKALHLHLIGISGYRTPQHSVEVGGFADDPHTRGEASDTPGVEGVPEATLLHFGLTRPFGGPAEADHIQLS